uniref:Phytocyanin domain-containing protein n=1 Tax=Kalanchoe fedtschenkoi TaxID=63787 RepID=A0A7N0TML8_KALFE
MALQLKILYTFSTMLIFQLISTLNAAAASEYRVGDGLWSVPPHPSFYSNWSSSHTFMVGDTIIFQFDSQYYDLIQVSAREHEDCTPGNPYRRFGVSPAVVKFVEEGVFYFTSSVGNYCFLGLRVAVTVQPPEEKASSALVDPREPALSPVTGGQKALDNTVSSSNANGQGTGGLSVARVMSGGGRRFKVHVCLTIALLIIMCRFTQSVTT